MSKDDLVARIKETGTDRYDKSRKQMFDDFYRKHELDFFGSEVDALKLEDFVQEQAGKFPERTFGDRGVRVKPDIAILYAADKCKMIKNVYDYQEHSDCYQFLTNAKDALYEVRVLHG